MNFQSVLVYRRPLSKTQGEHCLKEDDLDDDCDIQNDENSGIHQVTVTAKAA